MRSERLSPGRSKELGNNPGGDVLIDLGVALVTFGCALQLAGARLQANCLQPVVSPQAPTPAPTPAPAAAVTSGLPAEGYVRIWDVLGRKSSKGRPAIPGIIPVSRGTWYAGVNSGRFPRPIRHGRITMWRVEDIRALLAQLRH